MFPTDSLLTFSFPMGRLLGVPLRLSFLMPVVVVALMWRVQDFLFGITAGVIVLMSLLVHELGHLLASRQVRHHPGIVVIWPLGGMNSASAPLAFRHAAAVFLSGPIVNGFIAFGLGYELYRLGELNGLLNPFGVPDLKGSRDFAHGCIRVAFVTNYLLATFNLLIPIRPLSCGKLLTSFLNLRFVEMETHDLMLRIGLVLSLFGVFSGFVFDISSLVALSAFLLVLHIHDAMRWYQQPHHDEEDSFMGYDFSEGYTSLNRNEDDIDDSSSEQETSGILERWRSRREEEKVRREAEERMLEEQQVDIILEKLHSHGRESLSSRELNLLNRVSARLREKNVQD
jgi:stage IV sporulation protein FB